MNSIIAPFPPGENMRHLTGRDLAEPFQSEGLKRAYANAYRLLVESGQAPTGGLICLAEKIAEESYRTGVETMSDIVQPDFAELSAISKAKGGEK